MTTVELVRNIQLKTKQNRLKSVYANFKNHRSLQNVFQCRNVIISHMQKPYTVFRAVTAWTKENGVGFFFVGTDKTMLRCCFLGLTITNLVCWMQCRQAPSSQIFLNYSTRYSTQITKAVSTQISHNSLSLIVLTNSVENVRE